MAYELTKKLRSVDMYVPSEGSCRVRLDANESCFNIMDRLGDEILESLKGAELNRYPDPSAEAVTQAFADFYGVSPQMCTAGNGSDELISLIMGAFLEKGDSILTLSPDFSMYAFYGYINELKIKTLQKEENLRVSIPKVIDYCNNNDIKAVIFSNPCNPTSLGVSKEDIIKLLKNVFCLVIVDEAYMDFWGESILDRVTEFDNLIVLRTCSKNMGLAALRLGFAVASPSITAAMKAVKSPYNTSSLDQAAACVALRNKPVIMEYTAEIVRSRKALQAALEELSEGFTQIERVYDSVTNFVFFKSARSEEICRALEENSVSVRRIGGYIRVTAGTDEENEAFLSALKEILADLDSGNS